jgi:hypothetical protein
MANAAGRYVPRTAAMICDLIAEGKTINQAFDKIGYLAPSIKVFWKWYKTVPEFKEMYEQARTLQADLDADKMKELGEDVLNARTPAAVAAHKVAVDVLKWQAEVRNKRRFGSRVHEEAAKVPMEPSKIKEEIKRLEEALGMAEKKVVSLRKVGGE